MINSGQAHRSAQKAAVEQIQRAYRRQEEKLLMIRQRRRAAEQEQENVLEGEYEVISDNPLVLPNKNGST